MPIESHHAERGAHLVVAAAGRQADGSARSYALVNAVMNTAVADEVIYGNPCRIRGAANTPRVREIRPATLEEHEVIIEAMPDHLRARAALRLVRAAQW